MLIKMEILCTGRYEFHIKMQKCLKKFPENPRLILLTYVFLCIIIFNELLWISVSLTHLFAIPDYMGFGC